MSKIIFIVQQLSQPRCLKRIEEIALSGIEYEVYGFNNGLYEDNIKQSGIRISQIRTIDKNSKIISKISKYYKLVKHIVSISNKADILYCFGFELGALCSLINFKNNYIYEEADISASRFSNSFVRSALIKLDKWTIKRASLVIFTSKGFTEYLFKKRPHNFSKIIFVENKLHSSFFSKARPIAKPVKLESITFGFIGLIRYPNTILRFAKIVAEYFPQHNFYFFGDIDGNIIDESEWAEFINVKFSGKFSNPHDLGSIYSKIDINIACYDTKSENVKIAEPNKFYESIFFQKPIVVSKDTYLARRVEKYNTGFSIDASNDDTIIRFINELSLDKIESIQNSIALIPSHELISDKKELIYRLSKLINKKNVD